MQKIMETDRIKILGDEVLFDGKFMRVIGRRFINKITGKEGLWEVVERKTFGNIVAILALTPENEVILTKSFRIPILAYVIELCAGLMDRPNVSQIELVAAELLEETGYKAKEIRHIATGPFNAGLVSSDTISIYLGLDAVKVAEPTLGDGEDIEVIKVPLEEIQHFLSNVEEGVLVDPKVFSVTENQELWEFAFVKS